MTIFLIAHYVEFLESLLKYFLEREGLIVIVTDNVMEACQGAREKEAFYIVKKIKSSGIPDSQRLAELRNEIPSLKVFGVFISDMDSDLMDYYEKCGADRIYRYPCDWNETIKEVVDLTVESAVSR